MMSGWGKEWCRGCLDAEIGTPVNEVLEARESVAAELMRGMPVVEEEMGCLGGMYRTDDARDHGSRRAEPEPNSLMR